MMEKIDFLVDKYTNDFNKEKIAIVIHLYDPFYWGIIVDSLKCIDFSFDLYLSTKVEQYESICQLVKKEFPSVKVYPFLDNGSDTYSLLKLMDEASLVDYVAVCKINAEEKTGVLSDLYQDIMMRTLINDNVDLARKINSNSSFGVIGSGVFFFAEEVDEELKLSSFFKLLGQGNKISDLPKKYGKFEGAMFWINPKIIEFFIGKVQEAVVLSDFAGFSQAEFDVFLALLPSFSEYSCELILPNSKRNFGGVIQKNVDFSLVNQSNKYLVLDKLQSLETDYAFLVKSDLFEICYYLEQYPVLAGCSSDLIVHYLLVGCFHNVHPCKYMEGDGYQLGVDDLSRKGLESFLSDFKNIEFNNKVCDADKLIFYYKSLNASLIDWDKERYKDRDVGLSSIVMPVFNNLAMTQESIDAIFKNTKHESFELIIVDNGSDIETKAMLKSFSVKYTNIYVVNNAENYNFSLGCNIGFSKAKGDKVVFINNDTLVTADWLPPLIEALDYKDVAVAQPLILNMDHTIQCMGVVFSSRSDLGFPFYSGMKQDDRIINKRRLFQAVTGACFAVRSQEFAIISGFDPLFINGQEDIDYCLRAWSYGMGKCSCAHSSVVYHHESKTEGRLKYTNINRANFLRRWKYKVIPDAELFYIRDGFVIEQWDLDSEKNKELGVEIYRPLLLKVGTSFLSSPRFLERNKCGSLENIDDKTLDIFGSKPKLGKSFSGEGFFFGMSNMRGTGGWLKSEIYNNVNINDFEVGAAASISKTWYSCSKKLNMMLDIENSNGYCIRGYQFDHSSVGSRCVTVGTHHLSSRGVFTVYFDLISSFSPLMFVLTDNSGDVLSVAVIPFPSLLRGGYHESEGSILSCRNENIDYLKEMSLNFLNKSSFLDEIHIINYDYNECGFVNSNDFKFWLSSSYGIDVFSINNFQDLKLIENNRSSSLVLPVSHVPSLELLLFSDLVESSLFSSCYYRNREGLHDVWRVSIPDVMYKKSVSDSLIFPFVFNGSNGYCHLGDLPLSLSFGSMQELQSQLVMPKALDFKMIEYSLNSDVFVSVVVDLTSFSVDFFKRLLSSLVLQNKVEIVSVVIFMSDSSELKRIITIANELFPNKCQAEIFSEKDKSIFQRKVDSLSRSSGNDDFLLIINEPVFFHDTYALVRMSEALNDLGVATCSTRLIHCTDGGHDYEIITSGVFCMFNTGGATDKPIPLLPGYNDLVVAENDKAMFMLKSSVWNDISPDMNINFTNDRLVSLFFESFVHRGYLNVNLGSVSTEICILSTNRRNQSYPSLFSESSQLKGRTICFEEVPQ